MQPRRIDDVDSDTGEVIVAFDGRSVSYGFGELDTLVPAYAVTIHKSQTSNILIALLKIESALRSNRGAHSSDAPSPSTIDAIREIQVRQRLRRESLDTGHVWGGRVDKEGYITRWAHGEFRDTSNRPATARADQQTAAALSAWPTNSLRHRFGEDRLAVLCLQVPVCKPQNLEPACITDDPKIQFMPFPISGRNFDKARQASLLFDGPIDAP
jgi:hypothetical protein